MLRHLFFINTGNFLQGNFMLYDDASVPPADGKVMTVQGSSIPPYDSIAAFI